MRSSWPIHDLATNDSSSQTFYEVIPKSFLTQHLHNPTRCRGSNEPSILDLVLTDGDLLNTRDYLNPLGKSDHSVLSIACDIIISNKMFVEQFNYSVGDYAIYVISWTLTGPRVYPSVQILKKCGCYLKTVLWIVYRMCTEDFSILCLLGNALCQRWY